MTADRWTRLNDLVADAILAAPGTRATVLAAEPDAALRREAQALVDAHDRADTSAALDTPFQAAPLPGPVGPWTPTARLGAGGMGVVYAAERAGEGFRQRAALKLIRPGFGADFRDRFLRERALLASLDHPGVAGLLDGGMTDDGLPYLAMELVEGTSITDYATQHALSLRDRIRLFVQACEAVAHAHRHLVVHRDLKPAHVLVVEGERGQPAVKLLDFGVAKLLDGSEDGLTLTGAGPVTLQYAAPEQLTRQPVTTATDVYALGLIAYEITAGRRPRDLAGRTAVEAERIVTRPLPPPSTDAPRVPSDLDTVVMKALDVDPERRYAGADALADDLGRWLDGMPVEARPATTAYRFGRFVRRHRAAVLAAAAGVAVLVGLTAVYTVRLATERDRAQAESAKAEAVNEFMTQVLTAADGAWYTDSDVAGPDVTVAAVLDAAAARLDRQPPDDPLVEAAARRAVGSTYRSLSRLDEADAQLRQSVALYRAHVTPPHPDLAHAVHDLGVVRYFQGHNDEAARLLLDARQQWAATRDIPDRWLYAYTNDASLALVPLGRTEEAVALLEEAIAVGRALDDVPPDALGIALMNLAQARTRQRRYSEAEAAFTESFALFDQSGVDSPVERDFVLYQAADVARLTGRLGEADSMSRHALDRIQASLGVQSGYAVAASIVRAWVLVDAGRAGEGEALATDVLATAPAFLTPDSELLARLRHVRGAARSQRGNVRGAEADLRSALAYYAASTAPSQGAHAVVALDLADVLRQRGAIAQAAQLARRAQRIARDTAPGPGDALSARADSMVRALTRRADGSD